MRIIQEFLRKFFPTMELEFMDKSVKGEILRRFAVVYMGFAVFTLFIVIKVFLITVEQPVYRIAKNIKVDLSKATKANCTYEDLKIIYDRKERIDIIKYFNSKTDTYEMSVDLSYILEDMIYDYYHKEIKDSSYVNKLRYFLKETNLKYPFDKLTESQKELFNTLKNNSGNYYYLISDNLTNISEELYRKNEIIDQYLNKSYQSYILAIIALCLTILQILPLVWKEVNRLMNKSGKITNSSDKTNNHE